MSGFSETTRQVLSNDITFIGLKQLLCEKRVSYGFPYIRFDHVDCHVTVSNLTGQRVENLVYGIHKCPL